MNYEEKLDLIVKAIVEAKKATRKGYQTKLYYTVENGLKHINLNELHDILLQLQDDEKVITVKDYPTKLKGSFQQTDDILSGELLKISTA